jgi:stage V sporulation protein SpoVS
VGVTTRVGLQLRQRLMLAPPSETTRSKGHRSKDSGIHTTGAGGHRDSATPKGITIPLTGSAGPFNNISQLGHAAQPSDDHITSAVAAGGDAYAVKESLIDLDTVENKTTNYGAPAIAATIDAPTVATAGTTLNGVGVTVNPPATTIIVQNPSRNAVKLRLRIMRFVWGSLCFSIAWLFVLVISIFLQVYTISRGLTILVLFRFFEECWCLLLVCLMIHTP